MYNVKTVSFHIHRELNDDVASTLIECFDVVCHLLESLILSAKKNQSAKGTEMTDSMKT